MNTYKDENVGDGDNRQAPTMRRWPAIVCICACSYYAISALTLPFANAIWVGELAPLAFIQLPKAITKSLAHDTLMSVVNALGMSQGSFSPDYLATHNWAMGVMMAAPALLLVSVFMLVRRVSHRGTLIAMVLIFASIDAIVTFWFDNAFHLKLFNASYF